MGAELTLSNILTFIAFIAPFMVAFFLISIGFMNRTPMRSVAYICSALLFTVLASLISGGSKTTLTSPLCSPFNIAFLDNKIVALSTFFLIYSLGYVSIPAIWEGNTMSWSMTIMLLVLTILDIGVKRLNGCVKIINIVIALLLGSITAWAACFSIKALLGDSYFFTSTMSSNNVTCSKPSTQTFKCAVYKNGQVIANL